MTTSRISVSRTSTTTCCASPPRTTSGSPRWYRPGTGPDRAWRLTVDRTRVGHPRFSPDGRHIAYTSWRSLDPEIHLAPVDGGPARRLTYWGATDTRVCGWTPRTAHDPRRLLARPAVLVLHLGLQRAHRRQPRRPAALGPGLRHRGRRRSTASAAPCCSPASRRTNRPPGSATGAGPRAGCGCTASGCSPTWTGHLDSPDVRRRPDRLPLRPRGRRQPLLLPARRHRPAPPHRPRRLLRPARLQRRPPGRLPVRGRPVDRRRPVAPDAEPRQPGRTARRAARRAAAVPGAGRQHVDALSVDDDGAGQRRRAYAAACTGSPTATARPAPSPTPRAYGSGCPEMLGGSGQVAYVTDADGEDAIEIAYLPRASGDREPRRLASGELGRVLELVSDPDGRAARDRLARRPAAAASRVRRRRDGEAAGHAAPRRSRRSDGRRLGGDVTELIRSLNGPVRDLAFSPDGAWLTWSHPGIGRSLRQIKMARHRGPAPIVDVTNGRFEDENPVFTRDGRYLAFLSWRGFDPVYDVHTGDLSFPLGCRPYLVPLSSATPSPFALLAGRAARRRAGSTRWTDEDGDGRHGDRRGRGAGEPGDAVPGDRLQVLGAAPGQRRRPGLAALADLGRARRDLRQPGRHLGPPHPGTLRHHQGQARPNWSSTSTGSRSAATAPGWSSSTRATCAPSPPPSPATATRPSTSTCGASCTSVDPAAEWRQAYDGGGPDHPRVLLGAGDVRHRLGRRCSTSTARWSNGSPPPTSSPTCCARCSANWAPRTRTSPPPAATRARRTTSGAMGLLGANFVRRDGDWMVQRILPGDSSDSKARSPLAGTGIREGAVAHPRRRPAGGPGRRARTRCCGGGRHDRRADLHSPPEGEGPARAGSRSSRWSTSGRCATRTGWPNAARWYGS